MQWSGKTLWDMDLMNAFFFQLRDITHPHLLIILGEGSADGVFVDCLHNTNDFSIAVADCHAEDGLRLIAC